MKKWLLLLAIPLCSSFVLAGGESWTIYIVRHSERASSEADSVLSGKGIERTTQLADWFADKSIQAVYSSDYPRTRLTAEPIAAKHDLDVLLYDPRTLDVIARALAAAGRSAVVVGHSNTTPQLAALITGTESDYMPETEYNLLYVVTASNGQHTIEVIEQSSFIDFAD